MNGFFYHFRWQQRTVRFKLLLIGELVIISGIVALWFPMRSELWQRTVDQMQKQLQAIAATAALTIDGDLHEQMTGEEAWQNPEFVYLQDCLRDIGAAIPDLHPEHIYTFRADGDSVRFALFTHSRDTEYRPRIGEGYPLQPGMTAVFESGQQVVRDLYRDEFGEWISAYAPIRAGDGRVTGLLEVDLSAEEYLQRYDAITRWMLWLGLLAAGISSVLGWFVLDFVVIRPLRILHEGMEALQEQDFSHRVELTTDDEFQRMGETLNTLSKELNAARIVQSGFFPRELPRQPQNRISAVWVPCDATAGDYYDVIPLRDDRLALVVADVSGHGQGPSLIMAACRSALRALASLELSPRDILNRLEAQLEDNLTGGRFITMIYGVLDPEGTFTYSNAGHGPTLALLGGEVMELDSHRFPLGLRLPVADEWKLESSLQLTAGDRLLLTSDGLPEAQSKDEQFFGEERISEILRGHDSLTEDLVTRLRREVETHVGNQSQQDDLTILCVERFAAPEENIAAASVDE